MRKIDYTLTLLLASISNMAAILEMCGEMASVESDKDIDRAVNKLEKVGNLLVEISKPLSKRIHGAIEESGDDPNET